VLFSQNGAADQEQKINLQLRQEQKINLQLRHFAKSTTKFSTGWVLKPLDSQINLKVGQSIELQNATVYLCVSTQVHDTLCNNVNSHIISCS
jgi:hypothetical protein